MASIAKKNILFLTAIRIINPEEKGIYTDLIRCFSESGHNVFVVCPEERRYRGKTSLKSIGRLKILYVKSLNLQKCSILEKGLSTLTLSWLLYLAIKKYLSYIRFDLIIYSTPPISYNKSIFYLKKTCNPISYLLLKDIFPQNAVDLNLLSKKSIFYHHFKKIEHHLYKNSDYIGCMSIRNRDYILSKNNYLDPCKVEVNPNSMDVKWLKNYRPDSAEFRDKWTIGKQSLICFYVGNLGKPQGISFLLDVLDFYKNDTRIYFFVIGDGTEYKSLASWFHTSSPNNARLLKSVSISELDSFVQFGDAGLLLLDKRFTIPNFPSRLLCYMENKMSIWAATDLTTDIRDLIVENDLGFWSNHGNLKQFISNIEIELNNRELNRMRGNSSFNYLKNNYNVVKSYQMIIKHL